MMTPNEILKLLPYSEPFLFVDTILEIDKNSCHGEYTFPEDAFYYKGHFKNHPVTPGVILTETMAQIGVVSLGLFLMSEKITSAQSFKIAMTHSEADYFLPVFPNEKVEVVSQKIYFRFGKLNCNVEMRNEKKELVCKGIIAGMIKQ